jgi:hypothetical protein
LIIFIAMKHLSLLIFAVLIFGRTSAHESLIPPYHGSNKQTKSSAATASLIIDYTSLTFTADDTPQLYVQFGIVNNTNKELVYLTTENLFSKFYAVDNKDMALPADGPEGAANSFTPRAIAPHGSINFGLTFKLRREPDSLFSFKLGAKLIAYHAKTDGNYEHELSDVELTWSNNYTVKLKKGWVFYQKAIAQQTKLDLQKPLPAYHALTEDERKAYTLVIDTNQMRLPVDTSMYYFIGMRKTKFLLCYVSLENHSNDTLEYVTMNCNYLVIFLADNKDFSIPPVMCFKNGPETIKIPPHGAFKMSIPLMINRFGPENRKFRIG